MPELEARLRALGGELELPATPDLAGRVVPLLGAPERRPRRWALRLAVAAAVALAALGAVLALSPGARSAVLEWLGLRGAVVQIVAELPPVTPSSSLEALGEPVTIAEAERRVGFEVLELRAQGPPDAVYVKEPGLVSLVYGRDLDVRLIFSQVAATIDEAFVVKKVAGRGTLVEELTVDGSRGLFLTGEPHVFAYTTPDGAFHDEPVYLARDVLLWERGPLTLRLEGELTRDQALELAGRVDS
jgi:hypothetical protein